MKCGEEFDGEWDHLPETEVEEISTVCLFCTFLSSSRDDVLKHLVSEHEFDLIESSLGLCKDQYEYIKLVNFLRTTRSASQLFTETRSEIWKDDCFMKPVLADDSLLLIDFEHHRNVYYSIDGFSSGDTCAHPSSIQCASSHQQPSDIGILRQQLIEAKARSENAESQIVRMMEDMEKMRKTMKTLVLDGSSTSCCPADCNGDDEVTMPDLDDKLSSMTMDTLDVAAVTPSLGVVDDSEGYFDSYAHYSIHQEMIQDKVRTDSYREFICKNKELFFDAVVLDLGCGTGILSLFVGAETEAKTIIAVDQSEIIYNAMDIALRNRDRLHTEITCIKGQIERTRLPIDKVDIIISEWMGYFLLFESMLDSVLYARNRYFPAAASEGRAGKVYPDKYKLFVCGICDAGLQEKYVDFWDDVYTFDMSCMKSQLVVEASQLQVDAEKVVTTSACILDLDINSCSLDETQTVRSDFKLEALRSTRLNAICGYFDTSFEAECPHPISFSTGPFSPPTHWKQTVFLIPPTDVSHGQFLDCSIVIEKNRKDPRTLIVYLQVGKSPKRKYFLR